MLKLENTRYLVKSSGYVFLGTIVGYLLTYPIHVLITNNIGTREYGYYNIILATVGLLVIGCTSAFSKSTAHFVAKYLATMRTDLMVGVILVSLLITGFIAVGASIAFYTNSEIIANTILGNVKITEPIKTAAPIVILLAIMGVVLQSLRGIGYAVDRTLVESIFKPLIKLAFIVMFLSGLSLLVVIQIELVVSIVTCLAVVILFYHRFKGMVELPRIKLREYINYTLPLVPAIVAINFAQKLPILSLGYFDMPSGAGIYAAAMKISNVASVILLTLNSNFGPSFSYYYSQRNMPKLVDIYRKIKNVILLMFSLWTSLIILYGTDLLSIFGEDFVSGYFVLIVLSTGFLITGITGPIGTFTMMIGRTKLNLLANIMALIIAILVAIIIIPLYGTLGAAIVGIVTLMVTQLTQYLRIGKQYKILGQFNGTAKWSCIFIVASIVMKLGRNTLTVNMSYSVGLFSTITLTLILGYALYRFCPNSIPVITGNKIADKLLK